MKGTSGPDCSDEVKENGGSLPRFHFQEATPLVFGSGVFFFVGSLSLLDLIQTNQTEDHHKDKDSESQEANDEAKDGGCEEHGGSQTSDEQSFEDAHHISSTPGS